MASNCGFLQLTFQNLFLSALLVISICAHCQKAALTKSQINGFLGGDEVVLGESRWDAAAVLLSSSVLVELGAVSSMSPALVHPVSRCPTLGPYPGQLLKQLRDPRVFWSQLLLKSYKQVTS